MLVLPKNCNQCFPSWRFSKSQTSTKNLTCFEIFQDIWEISNNDQNSDFRNPWQISILLFKVPCHEAVMRMEIGAFFFQNLPTFWCGVKNLESSSLRGSYYIIHLYASIRIYMHLFFHCILSHFKHNWMKYYLQNAILSLHNKVLKQNCQKKIN